MKKDQHISTIKGLIILFVTVGLILAVVFVLFHPWRSQSKTIESAPSKPSATPIDTTSTNRTLKEIVIPKNDKYFLKTKAEKSSSILKVSGTTSLPDGSELDIIATRAYTIMEDAKNYEGTLGISKATVQKGEYSTVFESSDKKWYDPIANYYKLLNREVKLNQGQTYNFKNISDEVKIETSFSPKNQTENILAIVGKNGEKLNGPDLYKNKNAGFHLLKATVSLTIPFALPKKIE